MKLTQRTLLVVGATSGMGRELVRQLLQRENRVIAFSRRAGALAEDPDFRGIGRLHLHSGDVRCPEDIARLGEFLRRESPDLDGVFYCAGVSRPDFVEAPDLARTLDTIRVNFEGAVRLIDLTLPLLQRRPCAVVAGFSSMAAVRGMPRGGAYCASKAALDRYLDCLRIDLYGSGIRVITIAPGYVETPMSAQNRFPMPGIWPVERGVRHVLACIEAGHDIIRFPWYHAWGMTLLSWLPDRVYWWLAHRYRTQVRIQPQAHDEFQWPVEP